MPDINKNDDGLAAGGYDVVAYFSQSAPVAGTAAHEVSHGGATYRFSTSANMEAFEKEPQKYAPAFGGFCPFGLVAMGQCAPTDPNTFRIQDGRLLLFFNDLWEGEKFDTSQKWDESPAEMLKKAEAVWPELSKS